MLKPGTWYFISEFDERWNISGQAMVGMFSMPKEAEKALDDLKARFGEPPADLEFGYMKD